ncbi:MAG: hypothetical protein KGZ25_07745 [Planctomycetes bacterium]|nr:hypothetical protein [Planctomycetota bacterium]
MSKTQDSPEGGEGYLVGGFKDVDPSIPWRASQRGHTGSPERRDCSE